MSRWRVVRLDSVASREQRTVLPEMLAASDVFHYSIPILEETGDGRVEPVDEMGSGKLLLRGGEVLISKLNPRKSRVVFSEAHSCPTVASPEFIALRPRPGLDRRFLRYSLLSERRRQHLDSHVQSVTRSQQRIDPDVLTKSWIDLPPLAEQEAIADFLDAETAQIDRLIASKKRLQELVDEQFAAGCRRAVTGAQVPGPRSQLRDQPWLPEVPSEWQTKKIAWHFTVGSGTTPNTEDPRYFGGDVGWVNTGDLRDSWISNDVRTITGTALNEYTALRVFPAHSLVIAMYGATIGKLGVLSRPAAVNQACCVLTDPRGISSEFVFYWLLSFRDEILSLGSGGGQRNISQDIIRGIRIPTPSLGDQQQIAIRLAMKRAKGQALKDKIRGQIDLLRERRQALITAAVSGELDVRRMSA